MASETLPRLNADKKGVLEVVVRDARNVEWGESEQRFLVTLAPSTVVIGEESKEEVVLSVSRRSC